MKLPFKRCKSKKAKAADVLGSVAKLWSELRIAKRASKGVEKGAETARTSPVKAVGLLALLGGAGALIARKLKGGEEPLSYMPPPVAPTPPPAAVDPVPWKAPTIAGQGAAADELAGESPASGGPVDYELAPTTPIVDVPTNAGLAFAGSGAEPPASEESVGDEPASEEEPDADEPKGDQPSPGAAG